MNSSHGDLLADRLSRLDVSPNPADHHPVQAPDDTQPTASSHKLTYDGYGFRPPSGMSSPRAAPPHRTARPPPHLHGLRWPGKSIQSSPPPLPPQPPQAKSTLNRLNASPAEKAARETRLAAAVRTVLECIGEDPTREGLLRTPERYAQA